MKTIILSDIHIDNAKRNIEPVTRDNVKQILDDVLLKQNADLLLIAGDISGDIVESINIVKHLNSKIIKTYWIPGNHEWWCRKPLEWYKKLSNIDTCLINKTVTEGDWDIIGNTCWYDYSFSDKDNILVEKMKHSLWGDRFCNWKISDEEVNNIMLNDLEKCLKKSNNKKIVLSHMVPFKHFLRFKDADISITNGYMGSIKLGEMLKKYKVNYSIFGHTHLKMQEEYENIKCICNPLGYNHKFSYSYNFKKELENSIVILNL